MFILLQLLPAGALVRPPETARGLLGCGVGNGTLTQATSAWVYFTVLTLARGQTVDKTVKTNGHVVSES